MKTVLQKVKIRDLIKAGYDGPVLVPESDDISELPLTMMAELHKNRSPGNHRRYFAFCKVSFDMQEHYDDIEVWRKVLQLKAGFYDEVISEKGKVVFLPKSIAWDKLDEIEFKDLFNRMTNAFLKDFGDKLNDMQINTIIGF